MFSRMLDVQNGKYSYIQETSREACERLHVFGYFRMGHIYINGLKLNQTVSRLAILADKWTMTGHVTEVHIPTLMEHG